MSSYAVGPSVSHERRARGAGLPVTPSFTPQNPKVQNRPRPSREPRGPAARVACEPGHTDASSEPVRSYFFSRNAGSRPGPEPQLESTGSYDQVHGVPAAVPTLLSSTIPTFLRSALPWGQVSACASKSARNRARDNDVGRSWWAHETPYSSQRGIYKWSLGHCLLSIFGEEENGDRHNDVTT